MKWTINHLEDLNKVAAEFLDYVGDKTIRTAEAFIRKYNDNNVPQKAIKGGE